MTRTDIEKAVAAEREAIISVLADVMDQCESEDVRFWLRLAQSRIYARANQPDTKVQEQDDSE